MNQFFLNFPDEATAISILSKYRRLDQEGNPIWLISGQDHAMWIIGTIYIAPDTPMYGERIFPALSAAIEAKVAVARAELAASILVEQPVEEVPVGEVVPVDLVEPQLMIPSDGFHVNLICADEDLPEEARVYLVNPQFPKVVWL